MQPFYSKLITAALLFTPHATQLVPPSA